MKARLGIAWVLIAAFSFIGASNTQADFVLTGAEHLDVISHHDMGVLYDSSTAVVLEGGHIEYAYVNNEASLSVCNLLGRPYDKAVTSVRLYDSGEIIVFGGHIDDVLEANNMSRVDIRGGTFRSFFARDSSTVKVSGGYISSPLHAFDNVSVEISGGYISTLRAYDNTSTNITGGDIDSLEAHSTSGTVNISGGNINYLSARVPTTAPDGTLNMTLHGYDFRASGNLSLVEFENGGGITTYEVLGTGVLTGKWFDDTAFLININSNSDNATILATGPTTPPEPYCGDANHPYPPMDFNKDCRVDLLDFAIFAAYWLECTAPECD